MMDTQMDTCATVQLGEVGQPSARRVPSGPPDAASLADRLTRG